MGLLQSYNCASWLLVSTASKAKWVEQEATTPRSPASQTGWLPQEAPFGGSPSFYGLLRGDVHRHFHNRQDG
jgi:hypothetical protein